MTPEQYAELVSERWVPENDGEMCWRLRTSKMPLDDDDLRLVKKLFDVGERASVYDLYRLNLLCHQAIGWVRAKGPPVNSNL